MQQTGHFVETMSSSTYIFVEALDAYDTFVIQRKGKDVLPTDLNRPDKFICFVEQSNSEKCVDDNDSNEIEEYWVFSRDDYLLSVMNYGVSSWIGVRSKTDPRFAEDDKWPSIVGWYVATIVGKDQSYPRLSGKRRNA